MDLLSQWRNYANDAQGYSIGLDIDSLIDAPSIKKIKVIYDISHPKELLIDFWVKHYDKINYIMNNENDDIYRQRILPSIVCKFIYLSLSCKNPAFKEEKEWRLIYYERYSSYNTDYDTIPENFSINTINSFKVTNNKIVSYITLNYNLQFGKNLIKKIYIGSRCKSVDYDFYFFLLRYCFSPTNNEPEIINSSCTYR